LDVCGVDGGSARSDVGVELKGVRGGVERRRGVSGLKARCGRRDAPGSKVLKERRAQRERGRMGTRLNTMDAPATPRAG
jgi:hypothetical protein